MAHICLTFASNFQIEVIPWVIADSNYLKSASHKLDPSKTVFVGALHGQLTAKGLAQIMDDVFQGVIYAGMNKIINWCDSARASKVNKEQICANFLKYFLLISDIGIDTDKFKYPLGSGRVTFSNQESYVKAISTAFIEVQTSKFKCKVFQIDPYLEDSLCSGCGVQHGPYFCRQFTCYR